MKDLKQVMTLEMATTEVDNYISRRVIKPSRLEKLEDARKTIIEAVQYGWVVINEDNTISQSLIESVGTYDTLKYKFRVPANVIETEKQRVKAKDFFDTLAVVFCAYSDMPLNVYKQLEPADKETADCIILFFV
jgi:hypothetical protein